MLLVWFISCQILSWIWKRLKASVLPTPLTRNEQKHLPKAAQQRDSAPITNTGYLKLQRAISSTLSLLLMAFPPTTTTPNTWGNTTFFNHTPVASQCILIAADWNSTAHITCQRTDMTWSQDTCILCGQAIKFNLLGTLRPRPRQRCCGLRDGKGGREPGSCIRRGWHYAGRTKGCCHGLV